MDAKRSKRVLRRSVPADYSGDAAGFDSAAADTSEYTYQGETTHFQTYYSNGLLNHQPGNLCLLKTNTDWRTTWSIITPGNFSGRQFADLLFYDPAAGVGEIYTTEGGNLSLLKSDPTWRNSWSIIVPCNLTGGPYSDLLFYDPSASTGEMYTTDGYGNITHEPLKSYTDWRNSWSIIVPCNLTGGPYTDLLFYDPRAGTAEMYTTDGHGNITHQPLKSYTWPNRWSAIVPCNITGGRYSDFLFYDSSAGAATMYSTDGHGTLTPFKSYTGLRTSWSVVKACNITDGPLSDFLFYDPVHGVGEFYSIDSNGNTTLVNSDPTWRKSWSVVTPGNFTRGLADDLMFYDPAAGVGEFYTSRGNTLATAVLSTCEADYGAVYGYFGLIPDDLPFSIYVRSGDGGATHDGCGGTSIYCDANVGDDPDLTRFLIVAEVAEVFMNALNSGWDCGASNGEGLSRIVATKLYPNELVQFDPSGEAEGFTTAPIWLASDQPDYVNNTEGTDQNPTSIGCAALFINYMHHQLGYDLRQIIIPAGSTLSDTYEVLTSRFDPYEPFKELLARRFPKPPGPFQPLLADNPFPINPDFLAYDAGAHTGEFYSTDSQGNFYPLSSDSSWRGTWSVIAPGNFTLSRFSDVLFYDAGCGVLEFYWSDGHGAIHLLKSNSGLPTSWTKIIPVRFTQRQSDDLLIYDQSAGTGEIYTVSEGSIQLLNRNTGWRTSWSEIIAANFMAGSSHDLFFYDPTEGVAELYSTNYEGTPELVNSFSNWSGTWSIIIPCNLTGGPFTDLFFYDRAAGIGELWSSDGKGNLHRLAPYTGLPTTWTHIQAIAFGELMFYDATNGVVEFHTRGAGTGSAVTRITGLPQTWSIIARGNFT